ncbi:hypothetical protein EYF80_034539 [Liparis tanakae]|uniref:Uncharacterized protein n=1 Tax=Liparis tanakae TaxID=230148 RepID=A0A4Z2GR76_9TELE|nr:hypothetical protein EYF80_034539 [Liparis tanakae]
MREAAGVGGKCNGLLSSTIIPPCSKECVHSESLEEKKLLSAQRLFSLFVLTISVSFERIN